MTYLTKLESSALASHTHGSSGTVPWKRPRSAVNGGIPVALQPTMAERAANEALRHAFDDRDPLKLSFPITQSIRWIESFVLAAIALFFLGSLIACFDARVGYALL